MPHTCSRPRLDTHRHFRVPSLGEISTDEHRVSAVCRYVYSRVWLSTRRVRGAPLCATRSMPPKSVGLARALSARASRLQTSVSSHHHHHHLSRLQTSVSRTPIIGHARVPAALALAWSSPHLLYVHRRASQLMRPECRERGRRCPLLGFARKRHAGHLASARIERNRAIRVRPANVALARARVALPMARAIVPESSGVTSVTHARVRHTCPRRLRAVTMQ